MKIIFLISILLLSQVSIASPIQLHCSQMVDSLSNEITFVVNLKKKLIIFGDLKYDVVQADDKSITGYQRSDNLNPGGEVIVIDRITGNFIRSAVYLAATPETFKDPKSDGVLTSKSFSGKCLKKVF